jgi:hypothetical protein
MPGNVIPGVGTSSESNACFVCPPKASTIPTSDEPNSCDKLKRDSFHDILNARAIASSLDLPNPHYYYSNEWLFSEPVSTLNVQGLVRGLSGAGSSQEANTKSLPYISLCLTSFILELSLIRRKTRFDLRALAEEKMNLTKMTNSPDPPDRSRHCRI